MDRRLPDYLIEGLLAISQYKGYEQRFKVKEMLPEGAFALGPQTLVTAHLVALANDLHAMGDQKQVLSSIPVTLAANICRLQPAFKEMGKYALYFNNGKVYADRTNSVWYGSFLHENHPLQTFADDTLAILGGRAIPTLDGTHPVETEPLMVKLEKGADTRAQVAERLKKYLELLADRSECDKATAQDTRLPANWLEGKIHQVHSHVSMIHKMLTDSSWIPQDNAPPMRSSKVILRTTLPAALMKA